MVEKESQKNIDILEQRSSCKLLQIHPSKVFLLLAVYL